MRLNRFAAAAALVCAGLGQSAHAVVTDYQITETYEYGGSLGSATFSFGIDLDAAATFAMDWSTRVTRAFTLSYVSVSFTGAALPIGTLNAAESSYYQDYHPLTGTYDGFLEIPDMTWENYFELNTNAVFTDQNKVQILGAEDMGGSNFQGTISPGSYFSVNMINDIGNRPVVTLAAAVPEPEYYALMLAGLGVLGAVGRKKRAAASKAA